MLLFVAHAAATWLNLTRETLGPAIEESLEIPLFIVFYTPYCSRCGNVTDELAAFASGPGNRTDVSLSLVNCLSDPSFCYDLGVSRTPTLVLAIGPKPRYWPVISSLRAAEWAPFIDRYVGANILKLRDNETEAKFAASIQACTELGGNAFFVSAPKQNDDVLRTIRRISSQYVHIGSAFSYVINSSITSTALSVSMVNRNCTIFWDNRSSVTDFIEFYKFGPGHAYDIDEWRLSTSKRHTGILFVKTEPRRSHRDALRDLAFAHCDFITFGWMPLSESLPLLSELQMTEADLPFFALTLQGATCHFVTAMPIVRLRASSFLTRALNGSLPCGRPPRPASATPLPAPAPAPNGHRFLGISFAIGLSLIGALQLRTSPERKRE
jgi:hypothetical protein